MQLMRTEMLIFCLALMYQVILSGKFIEPQGMNVVLGVKAAQSIKIHFIKIHFKAKSEICLQ